MTEGTQKALRRVLLVTGGSRGIGAELVRRAAEEGYAVGFTWVENASAAETLVKELRERGHKVCAVRADVAALTEVRAAFDAVEAELGEVSALVNNAGVTGRLGRFVDAAPDTLRRVVDVNVLGTLYCAQEASRRWLARGAAAVMVNVSSIAASLGAPGEYVHYAASKAAVEALTVGLARELAEQGIRVNAVAPGTTRTEIHAAAGDAGRPDRVASRIPLRRAAEPGEIADAVLWLLSDKASYVTGAVLRVAGGL